MHASDRLAMQTFIHYNDLQIGRAVQHFQHPMQLHGVTAAASAKVRYILQVSNAFRVPGFTTECWRPHPVTSFVYILELVNAQGHMTAKQPTCARAECVHELWLSCGRNESTTGASMAGCCYY